MVQNSDAIVERTIPGLLACAWFLVDTDVIPEFINPSAGLEKWL